jgi:hypothetical protein
MTDPENVMYETIGRAVASCQMFEFLFVACVKLVFKRGLTTAIDDHAPLDHNSFRPAVKALLNELKDTITVDQHFEKRIKDFTERRHTLIHRWFIQQGWPSSSDGNSVLELLQFAADVTRDALDLSSLLSSYVVEWMSRFPEMEASGKRLKQEWAERFANAQAAMRIEKA